MFWVNLRKLVLTTYKQCNKDTFLMLSLFIHHFMCHYLPTVLVIVSSYTFT